MAKGLTWCEEPCTVQQYKENLEGTLQDAISEYETSKDILSTIHTLVSPALFEYEVDHSQLDTKTKTKLWKVKNQVVRQLRAVLKNDYHITLTQEQEEQFNSMEG